jgi:hypothetical protein
MRHFSPCFHELLFDQSLYTPRQITFKLPRNKELLQSLQPEMGHALKANLFRLTDKLPQ